jgi:hypothetical protein
MVERLVHLCKGNFKDLLAIVLIHIEAPMARIPLSMIHEFAHNVTSVAVRNLGVRQADTEVVFDSIVIITELECVSWHYVTPADCKRIEAHPLCAVGTVDDETTWFTRKRAMASFDPPIIQQQKIGLSVQCRDRYSTIEF